MKIDFWLGNKLSTLHHQYYETQQFHSLIDKSKHWKARGIKRQPSNTSNCIDYWLSLSVLLQKTYTHKYSERYLILATNLLFHIITFYICLKWAKKNSHHKFCLYSSKQQRKYLSTEWWNKQTQKHTDSQTFDDIQTHETRSLRRWPIRMTISNK